MNSSIRSGEAVPLYTSIPQQLVEWANSSELLHAINMAADTADRSIAALNKEREVRREDLHLPITL
tara:strand:+ start:4949 stop:5146 length:198 start_codon:yes stop_codon:yes gene_type:complete